FVAFQGHTRPLRCDGDEHPTYRASEPAVGASCSAGHDRWIDTTGALRTGSPPDGIRRSGELLHAQPLPPIHGFRQRHNLPIPACCRRSPGPEAAQSTATATISDPNSAALGLRLVILHL